MGLTGGKLVRMPTEYKQRQVDDSKDSSELRSRGSFFTGLYGVECCLKGGTKTNGELEEEEGDDGTDEVGFGGSGAGAARTFVTILSSISISSIGSVNFLIFSTHHGIWRFFSSIFVFCNFKYYRFFTNLEYNIN